MVEDVQLQEIVGIIFPFTKAQCDFKITRESSKYDGQSCLSIEILFPKEGAEGNVNFLVGKFEKVDNELKLSVTFPFGGAKQLNMTEEQKGIFQEYLTSTQSQETNSSEVSGN